jgi:dTDP-L-rhamnose 4-epimerase
MRVLVTGGAGFIGTRVVAALESDGHTVDVLDLRAPECPGDVRDRAAIDRRLRDVDAVVHQAAKVGMSADPADLPDYVSHNDLGTAVLLAGMARAGVGRLVLASSMVVYGEGGYRCAVHGSTAPAPRRAADLTAGHFDPRCPRCGDTLTVEAVDEDAPLRPSSGYAATKLAQENLAAAWAAMTGGTVVALRYHNVYGPGMPRDTPYAGVAAIFRSALEHGRPPRVYEDGAQLRDFVHVDDIARANVAAVSAAPPRGSLRPYNIASGQPRTVGAMAAALSRSMGGPEPVVTGEFRAGDVRHVIASPTRAARELGYTARVPLETGITDLIGDTNRRCRLPTARG